MVRSPTVCGSIAYKFKIAPNFIIFSNNISDRYMQGPIFYFEIVSNQL